MTTSQAAEGFFPTVLVTGTGSSTGLSVFKALRASALHPRIIATDAQPISSGLFRADASYVLPWVHDEGVYLERLTKVCLREAVAMICFGSEAETRTMARHRDSIEEATGAKVILNDAAMVEVLLDKWTMVGALAEHGLAVPDSAPADDPERLSAFLGRHEPPFVLKGRRSSGSKQVHIVESHAQLELLRETVPLPMVQEYLRPDNEEYTVGVYRSPRSGYVGQIIFRRQLAAGLTYKAEVVDDAEIEHACRVVVDRLDLWGPVNLQLRKTDAGVRIFEVNLRFSSSAVMRAHFGFNEPELCIREFLLGERLEAPVIRKGIALRYWDELYLEPHEYAAVPEDRRVGRSGVTDGLF